MKMYSNHQAAFPLKVLLVYEQNFLLSFVSVVHAMLFSFYSFIQGLVSNPAFNSDSAKARSRLTLR